MDYKVNKCNKKNNIRVIEDKIYLLFIMEYIDMMVRISYNLTKVIEFELVYLQNVFTL